MDCVISESEFEKILCERFGGRSSDSAFMTDPEYKHNQVILKKYSDENENVKYKCIYMNALKVEGIEKEKKVKCEYENDSKFESSLIRAKSRIFDLAFCNPWEFFFTGTIDPKKYNRTDLKKFHNDFTQYIRNLNRNHNCNIKFLIVPELHNDNESWHFHGFLMGIPINFLERYFREDFYPYTEKRLPCKLLNELSNGFKIFSWIGYAEKFGYCTLEPIKNHSAVSSYVTKYITKDVLKSVSDVGAHTYYRSRDLKLPDKVFQGSIKSILLDSIDWNVENDFCKIAWISENEFEFIKGVLE